MGEEEPSKAEAEAEAAPETAPLPDEVVPEAAPLPDEAASKTAPPVAESVKDVAEEKAPVPQPVEEKPDDSKALVIVEKVEDPPKEKTSGGSTERDAALARLSSEKCMSLIKAWEDNEKTKAENKATKKLSAIAAWENSKQADVEAELKRKEEELEKQKAEYAEKIKNKISLLHKAAEEKRAMVEARRGEEILKAEELAAKHRATGFLPKKVLGCFG